VRTQQVSTMATILVYKARICDVTIVRSLRQYFLHETTL